ncbi:MAG: protein kinase [Sedimentisphaerales bacterium]|nr:protein kinase [Sedimentisphaerales bacterium]
MDCPDHEIIERYVLGRLERPEAAGFSSHLQDCPDCRKRVSEARENDDFLAELRNITRDRVTISSPGIVDVITVDDAQGHLGERYHVIRKIGEGASGQVFQALDTLLERLVAVKFLRPQYLAPDSFSEAWHEARLMSKLNHPNVAQIYEVQETGDRRFLIMEWVDGLSATEAWKNLPLQQRLRVYLDVLDAVGAAHRRGIVHRDIKPSNILLTSDRKPKVLDFGISVDAATLREQGDQLYQGTPAYSAPEQITPPVKISTATDVFALGVLLYELLTDTLPFPQTQVDELFRAIRGQHPELPSALEEKVPIPLQNICLRALEKDPARRYRNAEGLADDVRRYLRGEKVWSKPSFLVDKVEQEVFYHRQKLDVWRKNGLLTEREFDKLGGIYQRMTSPPDTSIIEARKLSLSQVCLYFGGWVVVLGSAVLFFQNLAKVPLFGRPLPAIFATASMIGLGLVLWHRKETRLSIGFLTTAGLLVPVTLIVTLGFWEIGSAERYPLGTETIFDATSESYTYEETDDPDSYLVIGNLQLYIATCCWLVISLVFLRTTNSSIFVFFAILAFLALLTTCYVIAGMEEWDRDVIAGRYLYPGIAFFVAGTLLDRRKQVKYAWPLCIAGLVLIVSSLSGIAASESTLFGWLGIDPSFLEGEDQERQLVSFMVNGLIYLGLASLCRRLGTPLQRTLATVLNWLGALHILAPLRALEQFWSGEDAHIVRAFVYRAMLYLASIGFIFASVWRQMKSFFFSGLAGLALAVQRITVEHYDGFFTWPISLMVAGIVAMVVSCQVPRWQEQRKLRSAEPEARAPAG